MCACTHACAYVPLRVRTAQWQLQLYCMLELYKYLQYLYVVEQFMTANAKIYKLTFFLYIYLCAYTLVCLHKSTG